MKTITVKKIFLLTGLCLSLGLNAEEIDYCLHSNNKEQTEKRNKELELELATFSNTPLIAQKADDTLSKLMTAKSPFIFSWIKSRSLDPDKDTEKIINLWRSYFSLNFIINKYPLQEKDTDLKIEKLFDRLTSTFFAPKLKKEFEKHFAAAKKLSLQRIESYSMNPEAKKEIILTLNSVKLYFPSHLKDSKFSNNPLEFFDWGIAYDPTSKEINIGLNALAYARDQTLVAAFAHELAHSFDSCRWGAFYKGDWPFQKVGTCLRQLAKPRDDSQLEELVKNKKMSPELALSLKANPTCNKTTYTEDS